VSVCVCIYVNIFGYMCIHNICEYICIYVLSTINTHMCVLIVNVNGVANGVARSRCIVLTVFKLRRRTHVPLLLSLLICQRRRVCMYVYTCYVLFDPPIPSSRSKHFIKLIRVSMFIHVYIHIYIYIYIYIGFRIDIGLRYMYININTYVCVHDSTVNTARICALGL